ncbi:hypothetical protein ACS0TY_035643 [Phlomoides rotata]
MERKRLLREEMNASFQTQFNLWMQNMPGGFHGGPQGRGDGSSPHGGQGSGHS